MLLCLKTVPVKTVLGPSADAKLGCVLISHNHRDLHSLPGHTTDHDDLLVVACENLNPSPGSQVSAWLLASLLTRPGSGSDA